MCDFKTLIFTCMNPVHVTGYNCVHEFSGEIFKTLIAAPQFFIAMVIHRGSYTCGHFI